MEINTRKGNLFRDSPFCDPDGTRTHDLLLRRQLLYPAELPDLLFEAAMMVQPISAHEFFKIGCKGNSFF